MANIKVSIVVNVYNGERYIAECLESVVGLSFDDTIEIIVIDDASTDGTALILDRYTDPRFHIIRLEQNVGAAAAITLGLSLVRGEFVGRIDYDDKYRSDFLKKTLPVLRCNPEAAFVCSAAQMIDENSVPSRIVGPQDYGELLGVSDRFTSLLTRHFVTAPTILARTEHLRKAIPIPAGMDFCDWYMNLVMAESALVAVIDDVTADYRIHSNNMHTTKIKSGMGEQVTFRVLERFLQNSPRSHELKAIAHRILGLHYADWGDKYFSACMDKDSLRCYKCAIRNDFTLALNPSVLRRALGLLVGREYYEFIKINLRRLLR